MDLNKEDIIDVLKINVLKDLHKQATQERSHYYVGAAVKKAIIVLLRATKNLYIEMLRK